MTPTARRLILYGALALTLAGWAAAKVNAYLVGRDAREAAANQLVVLEALGARRATVAARNAEKRLVEMQAVVPGLERELAAAKAAGAPAASETSASTRPAATSWSCAAAPAGSALVHRRTRSRVLSSGAVSRRGVSGWRGIRNTSPMRTSMSWKPWNDSPGIED